MADNNNVIGSVAVEIEADDSQLKGQYDDAVAMSQDAAGRIADAFESIIGIGEALAITEGLKEFGEEALQVFGTVQSVTIGLTQLTGSATKAAEIIAQVKDLAETEPFAFPEIAPTVQKMVALGVSAEAIPRVMQAAADTAAATGNSFDAVANSIDRLALSGNAGARQLTQLGLSTSDLAREMGVSADAVKKAFTELDQSERLDVLTAALDKFAGAAEAQAQGIAGEWQIFQNKFEEVMEGVGEALTPAIQDLLSFGDKAIGVAQELIDGFNKLPGPVKEVAGALAIVTASVAPLAVGIGVLGQGLIGIQAVVGSTTELLKSFGIVSGEAAVAETAQGTAAAAAAPEVAALATAEAAAGEAASISAVQLGLFGEAVEAETVYTSAAITQLGLFDEATAATAVTAGESAAAVGGLGLGITGMGAAATTAGAAIAVVVGYKLGEWASNASPAFKQLTQDIIQTAYAVSPTFADAFHALTGRFIDFGGELEGQAEEIKNLQAQLASLGITVSSAGLSTEQYIDALRKARAAHQDLDASVSGTQKALDALNEKQLSLNQAVTKAQQVLALATKELADGTIGYSTYEAAVKALDDAQKKAAEGNKNYMDTVAGISETYSKQQGTIATLQQTVMALMAAQDGTQASAERLALAQQKLDAAYVALAKDAKSFGGVIQGTGENFVFMGDQAEALVQHQRNLTLSVQQSAAILKVLQDQQDSSPEHTRAVIQALTDWQTAIKNTGGDINQLQSIVINGVLFSGKLPDVIKQAQDQLKEFGGSVVTVAQEWNNFNDDLDGSATHLKTISDTLTGQITVIKGADDALKQYHGTIVDGQPIIAGYVDDTTKAIGYNKQFTGSVNDMGAAIGNTLTPNLNSATSSLSNLSLEAEQAQMAMKKLGDQAKQTGDEIDQAISAMDNWDSHMGSADATGLGSWALAAQMTGETVFAGSGSATNAQGQQVSALTELQGANTEYINSLAKATTTTQTATTAVNTHTSATTTNTTAVVSSTAAVTAAASAATTLASATGGVSNALGTTTQAAQTFVDGLGNVYNSYQALVDAIKNNPLLAGPAQSVTGTVSGGSSTAPTAVFGPDGKSYPSAYALQQAIDANPNILAHQGGTVTSFVGPQAGGVSSTVSQSQFLNSLASLFPGSFSMQSAIAQTPGVPFGSGPVPNSGATPVQVVMNYPQFNSQQQSTKVMSDMVTMLRNVAGQKL